MQYTVEYLLPNQEKMLPIHPTNDIDYETFNAPLRSMLIAVDAENKDEAIKKAESIFREKYAN